MERWDLITFTFLIFTAIATPFEVAFTKTDLKALAFWVYGWQNGTAMFWINRIVDIVFFKDMIMQFFIMYEEQTLEGPKLVKDQRRIAYNYATSWFPIDFISVIPFDVIGLFLEGAFGNLKALRMLRVIRLIKLARLIRSSRILNRLQAKYAISFAFITLSKFIVLILLTAHWMACAWGMVAGIQDQNDSYNWYMLST
jgi:hypothetical protein